MSLSESKLKIDARRKRIRDILQQEGRVDVNMLSDALRVTQVTIRNDLAVLEREGYLLRTQGGAVRIPAAVADTAENAAIQNAKQKQAIGATVARMIKDADTLFINSGTTSEYIAQALKIRRELNVVTNSLKVASILGSVPTFRVLLVGGEINTQFGFTHGGDAQDQLGKYQADWAILSVDGISAQGGVTTHHAQEAVIDRMMVQASKRWIIAADSSKIGRAGFSRVCECSTERMVLVTDGDGDPQALAQLTRCGVAVHRAGGMQV